MPRKSLTASQKPAFFWLLVALFSFAWRIGTFAAENNEERPPEFLGASSCSSSGCHGGAGAHQNQYLVWSLRDFHFQRPYATLTTARSKQISAALQNKDATTAHQCVDCHAPLHELPGTLRAEGLRIPESVSCEPCHAPAENWMRSHTR